MIIDLLSPRAFRCDCAVASTIVNWFLLESASSFLNSAANPIIEKTPASRYPLVDQNRLSMIVGSAKESRRRFMMSYMVGEGTVTNVSDCPSGLSFNAKRR